MVKVITNDIQCRVLRIGNTNNYETLSNNDAGSTTTQYKIQPKKDNPKNGLLKNTIANRTMMNTVQKTKHKKDKY